MMSAAMLANAEVTMKKEWRELTKAEERVIVDKGTEPPRTGKFDKFFESGFYTCRRCAAVLYRSDNKFDSACGWPAFDDAVYGAVKQVPDADGRRTEILCNNCGGHLGHVFVGERLTPANTRHCVNSISMDFISQEAAAERLKKAVFAGGCFWGVEYYLQQMPGVIAVISGYTGGRKANPTYEEVCSGRSGHIEAVEVLYDPALINYAALAKRFFEIHDPTQVDRQGPDKGEQYKSAIFYADEEQKKIVEALIGQLKARQYKVVTELKALSVFYPAELYHQDYYFKNKKTPFCHSPVSRFE
ncbi:MAG: bifunctional methionine sulfoxide reductase B/A protein [Kiritimatiellae bacterium]|nr:bifunctional methionine sulfoxide reductase B/A protein [Kiritimatiellia bacterium]